MAAPTFFQKIIFHKWKASLADRVGAHVKNVSPHLSWSWRRVSHGECTSVCDAHWTRLTMNHEARLSIVMIHQTTILHELSTLRGYWVYAKINRRLWPMGWDPKMVISPYGLGHCWWRLVATGILNRGTMIFHRIETVYPLGWSKGHMIMKSMAIYSNSFSGIWHIFLGARICHLIT